MSMETYKERGTIALPELVNDLPLEFWQELDQDLSYNFDKKTSFTGHSDKIQILLYRHRILRIN